MPSQEFIEAATRISDESDFMKKSNRETRHLLEALQDALESDMTPKEKISLVADRLQDQEPDLFSLIAALDTIHEELEWYTDGALKILGSALLRSREPKMYNLLFEGKN